MFRIFIILTSLTAIQCCVDLVLVLQASNRINEAGANSWSDLLSQAQQLVGRLPAIGESTVARVSVVTYGSTATVRVRLNQFDNMELLKSNIGALELEDVGAPDLGNALRVVREDALSEGSGERPQYQNVVLVFTDGGVAADPESLTTQSELLLGTGADVYVFSLSHFLDLNQAERSPIQSVASSPWATHYFERQAVSEFAQVHPWLFELSPALRNCLPVVSTPLVPTSPPDTNDTCADVLLVVDSSAALDDVESGAWSNIRSLLTTLISGLSVGSAATQVGVVLLGDSATVAINLGEHGERAALTSAITELGFVNEQPNLGDGLRLALEEFNTRGRAGAPRTAMVIYGGEPLYGDLQATFMQHARSLKDARVDTSLMIVERYLNNEEAALQQNRGFLQSALVSLPIDTHYYEFATWAVGQDFVASNIDTITSRIHFNCDEVEPPTSLPTVPSDVAMVGNWTGSLQCGQTSYSYTLEIRQVSLDQPLQASLSYDGLDNVTDYIGVYMAGTGGFVFTVINGGLVNSEVPIWGFSGLFNETQSSFEGNVCGTGCLNESNTFSGALPTTNCDIVENVATRSRGAKCKASGKPRRKTTRCGNMLDDKASTAWVDSRRAAGASVTVTLDRQYVAERLFVATDAASRITSLSVVTNTSEPLDSKLTFSWNPGAGSQILTLGSVVTDEFILTIESVSSNAYHGIKTLQLYAVAGQSC